MNAYLTSPVTPIVIIAVAVAGTIALLTTRAAKQRKREREAAERKRMEERVARQLAAELRPKKPTIIRPVDPVRRVNLPRSAKTGRYKAGTPTKRPVGPARISAPAAERRSSDTDFDVTTPLLMGMMFDSMNNNSNNDPSPSPSYDPSPSPSYDPSPSPSYDSGSSSSFDSGGSFSGGDSGSF